LSRYCGSARGPFPRQARLLSSDDFGRVFKRAQRSADQDFTILSRSNDLGWARLGLVVSRKVSPRAVERNRIKRMVRESFRQHQDQLGQLDLVVIGKPAAAARSRTELTRSLERHWSRIAKHRRAPVHD